MRPVTVLALAFALLLPLSCSVRAAERVRLGIDVLLEPASPFAEALAGKRLGLITNPSGVDGALFPTADRLAMDARFRLVQLYGPEHGIRGEAAAGDAVADELDPLTNLPVQSLYGARKAPSPDTLERLDVVVFDIQDIGSRTYTYVSTLGETLKACAAAHKPLVVLDRPNPIGGTRFEGPLVREPYHSFIGWGPLPVTHGMTIGEVARLYNDVLEIGCELTVVPLRGWKRDMVWEDTRLTWTTTSPHIPHALQAHLYVTTGMVASSTTNVSDGVGTPMPFEALAAEFFDGNELADELDLLRLPGVRFQPTAFKPFYGKFNAKPLRGVRLVLDDPRVYRPLHTAVAVLVTLRKLYGERVGLADELTIGKHWGNAELLGQLERGATLAEIEASWSADLARFERSRAAALIY